MNKDKVMEEIDHLDKHYLTLEFEGESVECLILEQFMVDGKEYVALLPEEEEEAYLYTYSENNNGEVHLGNLEDDEFKKVAKIFSDNFEKKLEEKLEEK